MPAKKSLNVEKSMNKSELRDLHNFVKDTQATAVMEALNASGAINSITDEQVRTLVNSIQVRTDECFFRFMDRL
tara:strand:- start:1520 stop:1741 length:222 start_codon:yes stop_codon:yes gene_type:complete